MDTSRVWNRSVSVRRTILLLDQFHILVGCGRNRPPRRDRSEAHDRVQRSARRRRPQRPDHPPGPPGLRQPEPAHGRRARPATLENYHFLEKISHFDRERIPERVVHARGATAFGYFEADGQRRRRADLASSPARSCSRRPASAPTSPCASRPWPAAATPPRPSRDPRGFAVKFYTEDGNWDLVGNNLGVFFIRDAIKFPDFIHSQKPDPVTFERQVAQPRLRLHLQTPEAMHMVMLVFGPRGIPASYRTSRASASTPTSGSTRPARPKLVKYHWHPEAGRQELDRGRRRGHAGPGARRATPRTSTTRSTAASTRSGSCDVQIMDDHDHPELDCDPLDDTKVVAGERLPAAPVGRMVLNRNAGELLRRERADRVRHRRAGRRAGLLRRQDARRADVLLLATRSATGSARTTCSCRSTSPRTAASRPTSATAQMAYYVDDDGREPARQLRAVDHRRAARGAQARPRRAGPGHRGPR